MNVGERDAPNGVWPWSRMRVMPQADEARRPRPLRAQRVAAGGRARVDLRASRGSQQLPVRSLRGRERTLEAQASRLVLELELPRLGIGRATEFGDEQLKPLALGFVAVQGVGARRAAIIYTLLRCCRLAQVEPFEYLNEVLPLLSKKIRRVDMPKLMPAEWARRRAAA